MSDSKDTECVNKLTAPHLVCGAVVVISILAAIYKIVDAVLLGGFDALTHMLFVYGGDRANAFWFAFIFLVSLVCVWLFIASLAALAWVAYTCKIATGAAACVLVLLCLVLGNILQQGCVMLLDFFAQASEASPFVYLVAVCFAVYCACYAIKGFFNLLNRLESEGRSS